MSGHVLFLTHADVVIDPDVPVPDWGLNDTGRARHAAFAQGTAVFGSDEREARDGAEPVAETRALELNTRPDLGKNDRSATGSLPPEEFWPVSSGFFSEPDASERGWERALKAQTRIVAATQAAVAEAQEGGILIVSHGGVATLPRCNLLGIEITQGEGQPHPKGACWFAFDRNMNSAPTEWNAI